MNSKLTKQQLYGFTLMKWNLVLEFWQDGDIDSAVQLIGNKCPFCYDSNWQFKGHFMKCYDCQINKTICRGGCSGQDIYSRIDCANFNEDPDDYLEQIHEMIIALTREYEFNKKRGT